MHRYTYVEIDLKAIDSNIAAVRTLLKEDTRLMAVVKSQAYGHGLIHVAKQALLSGASMLGVAICEEGEMLRKAGIEAPVMVLGAPPKSSIPSVIENNLIQCVFLKEHIEQMQKYAGEKGRIARVHIKIDTGMNRIGVKTLNQFEAILQEIARSKAVKLTGIFTHFASADFDPEFTAVQMKLFNNYIDALYMYRQNITIAHAANSAALLKYPQTHFDMVRAGLCLYGASPFAQGSALPVKLTPAMTWKSQVIAIKQLEAGETVSYGRRFITKGPTTIATLPIGYGDGYIRRIGESGGQVLIKGRRAAVTGTICMDQVMVDVTNIPGVKVGDRAVLLGKQEDDEITMYEMADWIGSIAYEVMLMPKMRMPRVYINA